MITKDQAMNLTYGQTLHTTLRHECTSTTGKRGAVKVKIDRVRVNGACKTWKTRPNEFRLPVKYGLRECFYLDQTNVHEFHLPDDCPVNSSD